ncbi:MAG: MarR family winged helix-turn-helix transcriptional regulator [Coriobacteriaceae bacterium]|nr:MarR family winged helix-turn-helix transcriptional regulator [Coriobacteriaceae bacterium]
MSENIENNNEIMDEVVETVETPEVEAVEEAVVVEAADEASAEDGAEEQGEELTLDDILFDKVQKAARLLRNRKFAMGREAEEDAARANELMRALKLLELKPQMEQKEMSDLLGMRLRELDGILREAEEAGVVTRVMPEEEDMRAVLVSVNENAEELAANMGSKRKKLIAQLSKLDAEDIVALMDKIIDPLTEMGLDNDSRDDRGGRGGDRGPRRDDRGGRGGFGGRGGDRGPRRDDRGGRGGFGGRDDRGPRRDFGGRDDRGGRGGFGGRDDRRGGFSDRGPRRDFGGRDDRGGRGGYGDRGGRGGFGGRDDRGGRGGYGDRRGGGRY